MSLSSIARDHNVIISTIRQVKYRPCPKYERVLAALLDTDPQKIWPDRYDEDGKLNRPMGGHRRQGER